MQDFIPISLISFSARQLCIIDPTGVEGEANRLKRTLSYMCVTFEIESLPVCMRLLPK